MGHQVPTYPYIDRYFSTPCGVALVWPFANVAQSKGPYELFMDTNALTKTQWVGQLPDQIREGAILNPWPALMEQWLSNPKFQEESIPRINEMIAPLAEVGIRFRPGFAQHQTNLLRRNERQLRYQIGVLFPYLAIMKSMIREKVRPADALARINMLMHADVPRFSGFIMLMALAVLLKSRQALTLAGDKKPAYSYLESFLAFQPGKKDETNKISIPYLRNRACDLSLWYVMSMLIRGGYSFVGEPVLVTGDKALHRVILRVLPSVVVEGRGVGFTVAQGELEQAMESEIVRIGTAVPIRESTTVNERTRHMENLFQLAEDCCECVEEKSALREAWNKWVLPGFGLPMELG